MGRRRRKKEKRPTVSHVFLAKNKEYWAAKKALGGDQDNVITCEELEKLIYSCIDSETERIERL